MSAGIAIRHGFRFCCPCTRAGHVAIAPPMSVMKSRRLICHPEAQEGMHHSGSNLHRERP